MSNKPKPRKSTNRPKSTQISGTERALRIVALVALVLIFGLSGLQLAQNGLAKVGVTPTAGSGSATPFTFPTVPPGGTTIQFAKTYIHPTGLFSISQPIGWDMPPGSEENTNTSNPVTQGAGTPGTSQLTRAGVTFIDSNTLSVIHVYTEHNSASQFATIQDLDKSYDAAYFKAAWANFTGGSKETSRTTDNNQSVVSFTLSLNGNTYLGRQISVLDHGWVKAIRLVTPDNNPGLMDNLQNTVWPTMQFFPVEANTPMTYPVIVDPVFGYVMRYLPNWAFITGAAGTPFVVSGSASGIPGKLTSFGEPGKQINSEADVRAWVAAHSASATVQTVQPATINGASGFNVSYQMADADGNVSSAVSTLLNGAKSLIVATFTVNTPKLDLLGTTNVPPDLATMRNTLLVIPASSLVPTLTPTNTLTPTITPTGADTLTAAANATLTAGAPTITPTGTSTTAGTPAVTAPATSPVTLAATTSATVDVTAATAAPTVSSTSAPTNVATSAVTATTASAATVSVATLSIATTSATTVVTLATPGSTAAVTPAATAKF